MSKKISNLQQIWNCGESCMSVIHGNMISDAVQMRSLTDEQVALFIHSTCRNFPKVVDWCGRTALHVAASCGRTGLCLWLISAGSDPNCKDSESGSSPLHRSIYHCHVKTAVKLMEHGSDLNLTNNEGLTPLNLLNIDLLNHISLISFKAMPCQVYIWGTNFNYTLGTGTDDPKKTPECLEFFKKNFSSIKQVAMDKFHTVFLTTYNTVWVCGHGKGGRLGVGNEKPLLIPTKMLSKGEPCKQVAVSINHTLVLLSNGSVLSSGSNSYYQLGTTPYGVSSNLLKYVDLYSAKLSSQILNVAAGKYHSVFYNKTNIVVCGLNAGQLGPKHRSDNSNCISVPSQLNIQLKDPSTLITHVGTSNGCIAYALITGDIYIIHQYQYKRIATKRPIANLACFGGILDCDVFNDNKEDLKVAFLDKRGSVYLWQMDTIFKCEYGIGRSLHVSNMHLNSKGILLVTKRGEAYSAFQKQLNLENKKGSVQMEVTKIPNIHRAVGITSDPEGNNFAAIQTHPSNSLEEVPEVRKINFFTGMKTLMAETTEDDSLHDLIINSKGHKFPVHRYILATRGCEYAFHNDETLNLDIEPVIIKEILHYIYIGEFEFIHDRSTDIFKIVDGLKLLKETAEHVKDDKLQLRIKNLTYSNAKLIDVLDEYPLLDDIKFNRNSFPEFWDVELISEEGTVFHAHKVVLASSLEYFRMMFLRGWSETKTKTKINFSGSSNTLDQFLLYIYTNKVGENVDSIDIDGLIKLLKVADQYLAENLKEKCEFILCTLLTLRNCVTILQVAYAYNASQLKKSCIQFICLNFNAILESRQLENIDDEFLKDIGDFYKTQMAEKRQMLQCESSYSDDISDFLINYSGDTEMPKLIDVRHSKAINIPKKKTPKKLSFTPTSPPEEFINSVDVNIKEIEENEDQILFGSPNYNQDFPSMSSFVSSPPKSYGKRKYIPMVKVPQRERKSMSKPVEIKSPSPKQVKGWDILPAVSNMEISSPKSPEESSLKNIIAFERQKKTNWFKMKTKPFHLTQMEDTAMEGLLDFYNASQVYDEKITVQRVLTNDIAQPMWIPSHTLPVL